VPYTFAVVEPTITLTVKAPEVNSAAMTGTFDIEGTALVVRSNALSRVPS